MRTDRVKGDDANLVDRCLSGDERAMGELITRFETDVMRLAQRKLTHRQDAEDVCQEVFIRVFRSLTKWRSDCPLRPWIMGIAVNRCRTYLSQRAKRPKPTDQLHETPTVVEPDDSGELREALQQAMMILREDYRAVFVMFHDQHLAYDEIAIAIGRPVGTIKTWLHRARLEVLEFLEQRGLGPTANPARTSEGEQTSQSEAAQETAVNQPVARSGRVGG